MRRALVLLALVGCGEVPASGEVDWGYARAVVWYDVYGRREAVPDFEVVPRDQLTCAAGRGFPSRVDGSCVGGEMLAREGARLLIRVPEDPDHDRRLLVIAHEYWHAVLWNDSIPDENHTDPGFQPGGMVSVAHTRLRADGF